MKKSNIILFLLGANIMFLSVACAQKVQNQNPNVVVLIADDVSWNDLGCYGSKVAKTPNIDKLASDGMQFNNAILTTSSCSPSRISIMTGRYPHNTGAAELHSEPTIEFASIASKLKENGYYTGQAGKWHMGELLKKGYNKIYEGKQNGDGGEDLWIPSLKERDKNKPFFFWFASYDAHRPWGPNEFTNTINPDNVKVPITLINDDSTRLDMAKYFVEIKRFDFYVGKVVEELKAQNVYDNTVIIIMADNGRPFPRDKTRLYDSGMKTPLIIHWPEHIKKSSITNSLVSSVDIAPTILDVCHVAAPETFQGKSFQKLFNSPSEKFRKYAFSEHNWHDYEAYERMARTEQYIYIFNARPQLPNQGPADAVRSPAFTSLLAGLKNKKLSAAQNDVFLSPRPVEELYFCKQDSLQLNNLTGNKKYSSIHKKLKSVLRNWSKESKDNIPTNLTKDWFDRISGAKIIENIDDRGEMPGLKSGGEFSNVKSGF